MVMYGINHLCEERSIPYSGIDTDARWGYSHHLVWLFGYKLHITSTTTGSVIVSLSAVDNTTANVRQ